MRSHAFLAFCLIATAPVSSIAQNVTHVIEVTSSADVQGFASKCSLREAFENVNSATQTGTNSCGAPATQPGAATRIDLSKVGATVFLKSPVVHKHGEVLLHGGTIDGGSAVQLIQVSGAHTHLYTDGLILQNARSGWQTGPGAVNVSAGADLTMRRSVMRGNKGTKNGWGGALRFASSGNLEIENVAFVYNWAWSGAALHLDGGNAVIRNTRIARNVGQTAGGGIYVDDTAKSLSIIDSRLEQNEVPTPFDNLGGGAVVSEIPIRVERTNFEGNIVTAGDSGSRGGGAILLVHDAQTPTTIMDSRFHENTALIGPNGGNSYGSGGGAIRSTSDVSIDGCTFSFNHTSGSGGAIMTTNGAPAEVTNSSLIFNFADSGKGAAIALEPAPGPWSPDANDWLGGPFSVIVANTTIYGNSGDDQFHVIETGNDVEPVLFVNNIVESTSGVASCGGDIGNLLAKRPNDNTPGSRNLQFPGKSCGAMVPLGAGALDYAKTGWFFDMDYRKTLLDVAGDGVVCQFVKSVDQFDNKRVCRLGAVEEDPKAVNTPQVPWWL